MSTIIAGGFENIEYGNRALEKLSAAGVPREYVCTYRVNPPGMHDRTAIGGDREGIGVGAYTASLVGGLKGTSKEPQPCHEDLRPAEMLVAVNADRAGVDENKLVRIFEESGAWQVERAEGRWADGVWSDFDPVTRPHFIGGRDRFDSRVPGENSPRP